MLEYAIFLAKKAILQFLCNFIPLTSVRIRARNAVFKKYLSDKIITLDEVDSHLPRAVLAQINAQNNEFFIAKNRDLGGGGSSDKNAKKAHFGYFDFDENAANPHSPLNPWAFVRVCNEAITLRTCLESILPAIQRGVIAYNDCTDGSEEIILDFCAKYPSFIPAKYPHHIQIRAPEREENKLHNYYNFALSHIPKNEWLIKIDCDHVYDAKKLYKAFYLPKKRYEKVIFTRIDFHIKNNQVFIGKSHKKIDNFLIPGSDHWLLYNHGLRFNAWFPDNEKQLFYEGLHHKIARLTYQTELANYHFPSVKNSCASGNDGAIASAFRLDDIRKSPLIGTRIDPSLLDEGRILAIYDGFDWEKADYEKP